MFNIGKGGVNNTKSPLHLEDTELVQAQNAEPDLEAREGGLRKRGGLEVHNSSALNSGAAVYGMANVPLLTTYTPTLFAALQTNNSDTWITSTDGSTWTPSSTFVRPATWANGSFPTVNYYNTRIQQLKNMLVYPNDNIAYPTASYSDPILYGVASGVSNPLLAQIVGGADIAVGASPYAITDMVVNNGKLYFGTYELAGSSNGGRVLSMDLTTGIIKQIANSFGGNSHQVTNHIPWSLCFYRGQLWVGGHGISGGSTGKVYRCNPDVDTSWTADTTSLQGYPVCLAVYKGDLYAGCQGDTGETAICYKRTASTGAWASSDAGLGTTTGVKYWASLTVHGTTSKLVGIFHHMNDDILAARVYDGTSWSTESTISSSFSPSGVTDFGAHLPGQCCIFSADGALYMIVRANNVSNQNGFIMKRTVGGVWSMVKDGINAGKFIQQSVVRS